MRSSPSRLSRPTIFCRVFAVTYFSSSAVLPRHNWSSSAPHRSRATRANVTSCSAAQKPAQKSLQKIGRRRLSKEGPDKNYASRNQKRWRRGGDSNPRHPFGVKLLSRQPCSATPAPLRGKTAENLTQGLRLPNGSITLCQG